MISNFQFFFYLAIGDLQNAIDKLKPKLTEVDQQLNQFDKKFSLASNSSDDGLIEVGFGVQSLNSKL